MIEPDEAHDDVMVAVLGAGAGSRMAGGLPGQGKLGRALGGQPLGAWALSAARGLGLRPVLIAPPGRGWPQGDLPGVEIVTNPDAASGMASSLVLAARMAENRGAARLLVMLADMPFVTGQTLRALVAQTGPDEVTACRYGDGRLGPPACFGARRLAALRHLAGDTGARHLLGQPGFADGMAVAPGELIDIDTDEDLRQAQTLAGSSGLFG